MDNNQILGKDYPLTHVEDASNTKERILLQSTLLFAKRGYVSVSMRDLAREIGLKPASLYNHFASKEELWNAVMGHVKGHVKGLYMQYFQRLGECTRRAGSFDEVLDCMFVELGSVVNLFTYYGFALVLVEQLHQGSTARLFLDTFMEYAIDNIRRDFDRCVENGWVPAFDTRAMAEFFMNNVQMGMLMRVQEDMGRKTPYDVTGMFARLHSLIRHSALTGFMPAPG